MLRVLWNASSLDASGCNWKKTEACLLQNTFTSKKEWERWKPQQTPLTVCCCYVPSTSFWLNMFSRYAGSSRRDLPWPSLSISFHGLLSPTLIFHPLHHSGFSLLSIYWDINPTECKWILFSDSLYKPYITVLYVYSEINIIGFSGIYFWGSAYWIAASVSQTAAAVIVIYSHILTDKHLYLSWI